MEEFLLYKFDGLDGVVLERAEVTSDLVLGDCERVLNGLLLADGAVDVEGAGLSSRHSWYSERCVLG